MRKYSLLRLGNWRVGEVEEKGIQERRRGGRGEVEEKGIQERRRGGRGGRGGSSGEG